MDQPNALASAMPGGRRRDADRRYWAPLRTELEQLRHEHSSDLAAARKVVIKITSVWASARSGGLGPPILFRSPVNANAARGSDSRSP
jgi:hypothetical protein